MASDCFIIMPISTPQEARELYGDESHFEHVLEHLFIPAVKEAGMTPVPPIAEGADLIHARIIEQLERASLVLCDMTSLNPNVFFELGIRTALDKPISLVKDDLTQSVPFDTGIINYHEYASDLRPWIIKSQIRDLAAHLSKSTQDCDPHNALWKYFGISSRAHSLAEGADTGDRLDYLVGQVEAMRREMPQPRVGFARERITEDEIAVGAEIRDRRQQLGVSLKQLAQQSGVSKATISRIENGKIKATKLSIQALMRALDVLELMS